MRHLIQILLLALLPLLASCGGSRQDTADGLDKALNTVTLVVDPLYDGVVIGCDLAEGIIIAKHPAEEGVAALAARNTLRGTCDGIFHSIEALRALQRTARDAINAYRRGDISFGDVIAAIGPVTDMVEQIKAAIAAFRAAYGSPGDDEDPGDAVGDPVDPPPVSDVGAWPEYLDAELVS